MRKMNQKKRVGSTDKWWQVSERASPGCNCRVTVCKRMVRSIIFDAIRRRKRWDNEAHFEDARKAGQHERVAEYGVNLR
jgi:hypothetical protein